MPDHRRERPRDDCPRQSCHNRSAIQREEVPLLPPAQPPRSWATAGAPPIHVVTAWCSAIVRMFCIGYPPTANHSSLRIPPIRPSAVHRTSPACPRGRRGCPRADPRNATCCGAALPRTTRCSGLGIDATLAATYSAGTARRRVSPLEGHSGGLGPACGGEKDGRSACRAGGCRSYGRAPPAPPAGPAAGDRRLGEGAAQRWHKPPTRSSR